MSTIQRSEPMVRMISPVAERGQAPTTAAPSPTGAALEPSGEPVGVVLRREREVRGLSLDDVADATKIPTRMLAALEAGDVSVLPHAVFVRGYVRAVARALRLPVEPLMARMDAEELPRSRASVPDRVLVGAEDGERRFGLAVALVVFAILATLAASFLLRPRASDRPEQLSARALRSLSART